ncbi:hypothetical protein F5X99DRAFT_253610 [Biscogniauxia marginata]|nr:hypothetical protein F5X99DRAFT_253610 [Biscogniauxia marginata]
MAPILSLGCLVSDHISRRRHQPGEEEQQLRPTRTLPQAISKVLFARQAATTTVVADSGGGGSSGLSGGAIAGIVVGTVAGTLLLLWLIRSCLNLGSPGIWGSTFEPGHEKPSAAPSDYPSSGGQQHHHRRHHHHHRRRSHSRHSRSRSPSRSPRRVSVVSTTRRPVVVESHVRGPRPPQPAYYPRKGEVIEARDLRRSSDGRRHRGY